LITACPLAIECQLTDVLNTQGDHVLFIGRVESVTIRDENAQLLTDQEVGYTYGGTK
jgi:flavin reductase (DIM6/NTAB) family NADH-FMN oxidoreductase RutF